MFNVIRDGKPPKSLLRKVSYNDEDVIEELMRIFSKKCYLCERKDILDLNVEHFLSHQGNEDKKYDWNNLYLVCSRCNSLKGHRYDNLLDCCNENVDVFKKIKLTLPPTPFAGSLKVEAKDGDSCTTETVDLLDKVYNGKSTPTKAVTSVILRKEVYKQGAKLYKYLNKYICDESLQSEKDLALDKIRVLMQDDAAYSAFIKWAILEDEVLCGIFKEEVSG